MSGIGPVILDERVRFANRLDALKGTVPLAGDVLSVEYCMDACSAEKFSYGGVGNNECRACSTCLFDKNSSLIKLYP